jgi:hypothetical protein
MFDIAAAQGVRGTYYFRLSTLDAALAKRVRKQGSEAGYHFEELATYAKRHGLHGTEEIESHVQLMRDEFRRNVALFRRAIGEFPRTIAPHGDFVNRRLGIKNTRIVDRPLMDEFGIVAETRDAWLMTAVSVRISDRPAPHWWHPRSPIEALEDFPQVLYLLLHPRQWARAPWHNTGLDIKRGAEEAAYFWRGLRRRHNS